ncbi:TonB-dependent receptor plug domain-containing protein [Qipengyuania sediminis]|uniref:TonB-dependent receptor plug domain-containing protein n=1 Tax=Qipengyuania sediminis TaxID=1532023 RepID=UPI001F0F011D|nr:TonB-dependent receptor [Qipengyuania sediminis]
MFKHLFYLSVASLAVPAAAQDSVVDAVKTDAPPPVSADEIVFADEGVPITVTATGLATDVANTGQSVAVIGRDEIEAVQGADIARIFARAPSAVLTRNGPLGSFTGVSVRGAASEQLLVLIDGVRVADQASPGGGFDFGTLLATNVGTIDLLRGANSTIWGADALGGVLDVSTRGREGLSASLEYGARDTVTAAASAGVEGEGYALGLTGSALRTDGFSAAANGSERDGSRQFGVGASAFVDLTDTIELFANARYAEGDLEIDGFRTDFTFGDTRDRQFTRQYSGAAGLTYYGQDLTLRASYSLSDTERTNRDGASTETFASDGHTDSITLRGEYRAIGGLTLAFGGEHQWSAYETAFDNRESVNITGGYLQAGWVLGDIAAHLGARIDDHELFGSEVSVGGDVSYGLGNGWRVKASIGEGFKAPTLFQLFSDFGNERLRPERATSYDLGFELGRRGAGKHFGITGFRRDSEDLIGFVSCFGSTAPLCRARPFGTYDNIARARAQGIEVEGGAEIAEGFRLAGHYAFIDTEDRASGANLARRPRHVATLFADYESPFGFTLGADLRFVGPSFDDASNTARLGGYELVDLRATIKVAEGIELFGRVENVFDADYTTAAGYGTPGRGVFAGVRGRM